MSYQAWFQCSEGCHERYPLNEVVYRCRKCGGLLEVAHDIDQLKQRSASEWMSLFDSRYMRTQYPYGSGVWGKKEFVNPLVDNENIVSLYEGGTNLFWAERFGRELGLSELWIKQCGNSHTGSFKDLGMTVLVSQVKQMIADGVPIRAVACASTGDTSAALAAYCAAADMKAIVLLPRNKVSIGQLIQPIANGALTLSLDTDFDGCMSVVQQVCERGDIYLANSLNSLRIEGQKTISVEIVQQFDWTIPDWIVLPTGNAGNISALGYGFSILKELGIISRLPRLVCAQAERANPIYQSYLTGFEEFEPVQAQETSASAIRIGNPVSVRKAIRVLKQFDGVVEQASEDELSNAAGWADRAGLFNCPHTGVALAALIKLVNRGVIKKNDRVVVISTAHGLKFQEWKQQYHTRTLPGVNCLHANPPIEIPPDASDVNGAIDRFLDA